MWIEFNYDFVQILLTLGVSMFGLIMLGVVSEWARIVQDDLEYQSNPELLYINNL